MSRPGGKGALGRDPFAAPGGATERPTEAPASLDGFADRVRRELDRAEHAGTRRLGTPHMRGRSGEIDPFGLDPEYEARWHRFFDFLYETYWRVDARGVEHIPAEGPALLVGNHAGLVPYDAMMLKYAVLRHSPVRRGVRPLVPDFVFHFPFLGVLLNRLGGVRACPENAERLLERGELVAVFPEGLKGLGKLYRERYRLQRFGRGGFVKLALRTGVPLLPVAIVGAEEIHPMIGRVTWVAEKVGIPFIPITPTFPWLGPLGALPLPSKWLLQVGPPVDLGNAGPEAADDPTLVGRLTESVRQTIQEMLDGLLRERRSVFR